MAAMSRRNRSVSPKVIWGRRIKLLAIVLACALLVATAYLMMNYKAPADAALLGAPAPHKSPAASGTAAFSHL
jgi:hypothetical protein